MVRTGATNESLDIIPTFGSGTLLISQRAQIGRVDIPLFGTPLTSGYSSTNPNSTDNTPAEQESESGSIADKKRSENKQSPPLNQAAQNKRDGVNKAGGPGGVLPVPLAVLSLHEMAYLGNKYGVWDRRRYAGDWFKSLDWGRVGLRAR